ncbi:MAG: hypothetical protein IPN08_04080 [Bacteroidales bacterium]|nr:hypothetical protein [Bacteroidales bacterium]
MKNHLKFTKWLVLLLLFVSATGVMAQTTDDNPDITCVGTTEGYWVDLPSGDPGSTYFWEITGPVGGWSFVAGGQGLNHIEINWILDGTYNLRVTETASSCPGVPVNLTIIVNPLNTIALTSGLNTDAQTVCINTPIVDITYATTGATGATFTGLPAGVTGTWAANVVTISGTPTVFRAIYIYCDINRWMRKCKYYRNNHSYRG